MAEEHAPNSGHEQTDVNIRPVLWFGAGLTALIVVVYLVGAGLFGALTARTEKAQPKLSPLAAKERTKLPQNLGKVAAPRLQVFEVRDMDTQRKEEEEKLTRYVWIDRQAGVVQIPVERAMQLLSDPAFAAAHGVTVRPQPKGKAAQAP
jgi:hypothetical protein